MRASGACRSNARTATACSPTRMRRSGRYTSMTHATMATCSSTRTDGCSMPNVNRLLATALLSVAFAAPAATPVTDVQAPSDLLGEGAALHDALARAIGHPAWVVTARLDAKGGEFIVQDVADEEIYDKY